jgi:hypothetical protein
MRVDYHSDTLEPGVRSSKVCVLWTATVLRLPRKPPAAIACPELLAVLPCYAVAFPARTGELATAHLPGGRNASPASLAVHVHGSTCHHAEPAAVA